LEKKGSPSRGARHRGVPISYDLREKGAEDIGRRALTKHTERKS